MTSKSPAPNTSMYRETLLKHFHTPQNKGDLDERYICARGSNPRCGDEVEIGLLLSNDQTVHMRFHGRGCIACLSSASIMADAISDLSLAEAQALHRQAHLWLSGESDQIPTTGDIAALAAVIAQPARKQCVELAWKAAATAFENLRTS